MPEKVNLACGNGCCPDATFSEENIKLEENGHTIYLNKNSLKKLIDESRKRGFIE